jgi:DNA-binding CsgD family transcriptional regulator
VQSAWSLGDFVEAAARTGRIEEAREVADRVSAGPGVTVSPWGAAALQYARPLLADNERAEEEFRAALDSGLSQWPFYRARLLLEYGSWLRRHRRAADARIPLRAARDDSDALGLLSWAQRARQELRATGEGSHDRRASAWASLSPQELHIALLAADGLSNREIAERLYLSHRTVGSHLYRLFPKLGVASRGQLHAALEQPPLPPP